MASAENTAPQRPKILEALGFRVISLTRIVVKKARELPFCGKTIGYVEDTLSPWLEPVISQVEKDSLYLLSLVDIKIRAVSDIAIAYVPFAETLIPQFQAILSGQPIEKALILLDRLRTQGLVGSTADIWVEYGPIVKSESHKLFSFVVRVPGVHGAVSILSDISIPLVSFAAEWLVTHTEVKDKHEISRQRKSYPLYPDSPDQTWQTPSRDEPDFNALAAESDPDSGGRSSTDPAESTEVGQNSKEEMDTMAVNYDESSSTQNKGKLPKLAVVDEDEDEQDELADLFDTWGMGVKAISPKRLNSLRSLSLKEDAGSRKPSANDFTSRSFRL